MNIPRVFEASGVTINFQGMRENPLFQANQIGAVLGLANIREAVTDFDEDEKCVGPADTSRGEQQVVFLTELGLHRLLFMSRKPLARPFQKWVATTVKELRANALESLKAECAAVAKKEHHETLVKAFARRPLLYLGQVGVLPDGRLLIKYGETDDIESRKAGHARSYGKAFTLLDVFPCSEPHMLEQWLSKQPEFKMRKYVGIVDGCNVREFVAVLPSEYPMLKQFIKKNLSAHSGWTIEQQLEKARYDGMSHLSSLACDMRVILTSTLAATSMPSIDPTSMAEIGKEVVGFIRDLRALVARPSFTTGDETRFGCDAKHIDEVNLRAEQEEHIEGRVENEEGEGMDLDPDESTTVVVQPAAESPELLPQPPKKLIGRPPKPKAPLASDGAPLSCFLDECFILDPEAKTLAAVVRARHRLWRRSNSKEHTTELCAFFDAHFQNVKETDMEHFMTSSYYKGLSLKPWVPPVPATDVFQADVEAFVRETCEVHVMGRVRTDDLLTCFAAWKGADNSMTYAEKQRVLQHLQASFYRSMVPVAKSAECGPGFFGIYNNNATPECREVGYNRSPNTRSCMLKLDSKGDIVAVIDSLQEFAKSVVKKTSVHVCNQLTRCFADNMRGLVHTDGYSYMRAFDYQVKKAKVEQGRGAASI